MMPSDSIPLVLAPGMLSDASVWMSQIRAFSDERPVYVANYDAADTFEDMARVLLDAAPVRFALAGHSMGARVAMEAVRLAPERIAGVCLISADFRAKPSGLPGEQETRSRQRMMELSKTRGMTAVADNWAPILIHAARRGDKSLMTAVHTMIARQNPECLARQIHGGEFRPDHAPVLRAIVVPMLLICGAQDSLGRAPIQADMQGILPGAEVMLIEDCGHLPTMEAPDQANGAMSQWLGRVEEARSLPTEGNMRRCR
jgi:pimeloyl-ACP methyl ester carboxylesterase